MTNPIRERLRLPRTGTVGVAGSYPPGQAPLYSPDAKPRKKEGHDALIQLLSKKGSLVELELMTKHEGESEYICGRLDQSDRFTISVFEEQPDGGYSGTPTLVYKHAIKTVRFETPETRDESL